MTNPAVRRRRPAFAAGLAVFAMALGFTAIPADAAPPVPDVDLVAVGDSYTAGTGAGPFIPNFPCDQTAGGYVDNLKDLAIVDEVINGACHGALLDAKASGIVPSVMGQIAALTSSGGLSGRTELVTLTAGANDLDFNTVLFTCAFSTSEACQQVVLGASAKLPAIKANLVKALTAIHRAAPRAKIAVFGYPLLFDPVGGIPLISVESQALVNAGTGALNATIAAAVTEANAVSKANAQYIDVTTPFAPHAANTLQQWIVLDLVPPIEFADDTFHPNAAGHDAYSDALTAVVNLQALARR
ncbi:SGNH/GDSL hydrolase family protein [Arthrobacter sp. BE255]|uniref:SGNH/GDSL hydrolase family protein n=1 Tax=Arthrobacter sp. BE255 TaxID=2817721 RepID=UPI00285CE7F6|nr:SGNH/GDSL hydrolase family protein [Arthrobacter sp. BE255]MDR7160030.1 lysophospholipase L1-like esterase [Arthrobacter sp. BE255]